MIDWILKIWLPFTFSSELLHKQSACMRENAVTKHCTRRFRCQLKGDEGFLNPVSLCKCQDNFVDSSPNAYRSDLMTLLCNKTNLHSKRDGVSNCNKNKNFHFVPFPDYLNYFFFPFGGVHIRLIEKEVQCAQHCSWLKHLLHLIFIKIVACGLWELSFSEIKRKLSRRALREILH